MIKLLAQHYDNKEETGYQFPFNYLHGEIERINGYDIVTKESEEEIPFGIHNVLVNIKGKDYECKLFTWDSRTPEDKKDLELRSKYTNIPLEELSPRWSYQKGLIVLNGDKKAMQDAYSKYKRKECII